MQGRDIRAAPISAQHWGTKERHCVAAATAADSISPLTSPISHKMITSVWQINKWPRSSPAPGTPSWPFWRASFQSVCISSAPRVCLHLTVRPKVFTTFCKKKRFFFFFFILWTNHSSLFLRLWKLLQYKGTFGPFRQQIPMDMSTFCNSLHHLWLTRLTIIRNSWEVWAQCSCFIYGSKSFHST